MRAPPMIDDHAIGIQRVFSLRSDSRRSHDPSEKREPLINVSMYLTCLIGRNEKGPSSPAPPISQIVGIKPYDPQFIRPHRTG